MTNSSKSFRKFLATATTVTITASAVAPLALAASTFEDVAPQYKDAVDFVVSKGITGFNPTTYGTYQNIKRVDAAVMIAKVLDLDIESAPASGFTDVPERAVKYVNALKAAGITSGKTATTLDSQSQITRGELAIWIQKAFDLQANDENIAFTDVADRYQVAVSALVNNEVTNGTSITTFGTYDNAKRGDFALFLHRASQAVTVSEVVEISAIDDIEINEGGEVTLPTEVEVTLDNEQTELKAVEWDQTGLDVNKPGEYTLTGDVADTDLEASVKVIVIAGEPEVDTVAPEAVTGLAFEDSDADEGEIAGKVTFTASTSDDVDHYEVTVGEDVFETTTLSYTIAENTDAVSEISVVAVDAAGNVSADTTIDVIDVTTPEAVDAVTGLSNTTVVFGFTAVQGNYDSEKVDRIDFFVGDSTTARTAELDAENGTFNRDLAAAEGKKVTFKAYKGSELVQEGEYTVE